MSHGLKCLRREIQNSVCMRLVERGTLLFSNVEQVEAGRRQPAGQDEGEGGGEE